MSGPDPASVAMPRFNWGAFFLTPVWGLAHRMWSGIFFVPLWVFVDNALRGPQVFGAAQTATGYLMAAVTLGLQAGFAARANGNAWRKVAHRTSFEAFSRAQRRWASAGFVVAAAVVAVAGASAVRSP